MATQVKKVKDWLQERSEKQFKFESVDFEVVQRLKDRQYFVVGDRLKLIGKSKEKLNSSHCVIDYFDRDRIHVYIRAEEGFLKEYISSIPINDLGITW